MLENHLAAGAPPCTPLEALTALPQTPVAGGGAPPQEPHPATLAIRASLLASPNPFTKFRLRSELNLF